MIVFVIFKLKTAYEMRISDWSSDVCSSDLKTMPREPGTQEYETLVSDYVLRHSGPTATANAMQEEDNRQENRIGLEGTRQQNRIGIEGVRQDKDRKSDV